MPKNYWNHEQGAALQNELEKLVYRSNLLGFDRSVANWGGGNTSVKTVELDFRSRPVEVLWVKGSGSDLATMAQQHFSSLKLEDIRPLLERDEMSDEEMVDYLSYCVMDKSRPRPSIETLLHAFLPFKHVDHTHPDAILSLCCSDRGREIAEEIFGHRFVWVPYIRPGFALSKMIAELVRDHPQAECVLMEKHGLVTWGETAEECYERTLSIINEAEDYITKRGSGQARFGGQKFESLPLDKREEVLAQILPVIRGMLSQQNKMILTHDASVEVMNFVNSHEAPTLSQIGAACPDHLVHTKRVPLYIDWNPEAEDIDLLLQKVKTGISRYQEEYQAYVERNRNPGDPVQHWAPRVILIPGIGMINSGKNVFLSKLSGDLYQRAIAVMSGATSLGRFVSLSEKESYDVEYWPLELYKLSLQPPEREFSGKVCFVTGGAGGIGSSICDRLAKEGAHAVIADVNIEKANETAGKLNERYGEGRAIAVRVDVTNEEEVARAFQRAILAFGGVDILVNNAGIATSNPLDQTSLDEWNFNINVLATGYFLVAREGFKWMKKQSCGGAVVFIGSKNAVYAGKNASAYSAAKAAEMHLARCMAVEAGEFGIRVNSVLPDAVLQGSSIWDSAWRAERAKAYGIEADQLEEWYRDRTILKANVFPEDIAEAVAFLASSKSGKTTGCMIPVDGGVSAAFVR